MSKPVILITGANRGIGLGYLNAFLQKGFTVIAAARDISSLPKGEDIIPVKLDALDSDAPRRVGHSSNEMTHMRGRFVLKNQAIEEVKALGVVRIDIVLANAGIFPAAEEGMFKDLTAETAEQVWRVNVLSPLMLYQATLPFIPKGGKFVVVGSRAGVLSIPKVVPAGAYGQSKAAVHFLIRRLHYENQDLISFAILPGHLTTDMGQASARTMGLEEAPRRLEDTLPGMMEVILNATRDEHSGRLCEWDGTFSDW